MVELTPAERKHLFLTRAVRMRLLASEALTLRARATLLVMAQGYDEMASRAKLSLN